MKMLQTRIALPVACSMALLLAAAFALTAASAEDLIAKRSNRYFEMRTYTAHEGKFDAMHARFRDHTNRLFVKHGMDLIGYWVPTDEKESKTTLTYILAYPDKASREKSWKAFAADPEWKKAYADSHKDGPLVAKVVSKFMTPTDYSPIR